MYLMVNFTTSNKKTSWVEYSVSKQSFFKCFPGMSSFYRHLVLLLIYSFFQFNFFSWNDFSEK